VPSYFDFDFTTYDTPPHTRLDTPPDPNDNFSGPQSVERPVFTFLAPDDLLPVTFQCSLSTLASRPGPWGSCRLPRLKLLGIYHCSARGVDVLGRADLNPPQYTLSPTPCRARVRDRAPTFAGFLHHGLPISVTCIQPEKFESDLDLPLSLVERYHLPAQTVGYVRSRTTRAQQTLRLTVHALRGSPPS
jgi:hypothetical protein